MQNMNAGGQTPAEEIGKKWCPHFSFTEFPRLAWLDQKLFGHEMCADRPGTTLQNMNVGGQTPAEKIGKKCCFFFCASR